MATYTKIIHQIWYDMGNGKNIPDKYKPFQESWKKNHPMWEYVLWNEEMGDALIRLHYPQYYDVYKDVKYPIMKIDILRYCILDKYGGMYADIDYKCLTNFDDYLNKYYDYDIHINETSNEIINFFYGKTNSNSLLISTKPEHIFWKIVLDECIYRIKTYPVTYHIHYVLKTTGPALLSDILHKLQKNNITLYNKINLLPFGQFNFCNDCNKCRPSKNKKVYAVHEYASYWNSNLWLQFRKLYTCISLNQFFMIIISILIIILYYFISKQRHHKN